MTLGLGPVIVGGKGPGSNEGLLFMNIYVQGEENTHFIIRVILSNDDRNRNLEEKPHLLLRIGISVFLFFKKGATKKDQLECKQQGCLIMTRIKS